jgi:murein DD-endopeptidase MepM/ murein hydrolase activator NlpD
MGINVGRVCIARAACCVIGVSVLAGCAPEDPVPAGPEPEDVVTVQSALGTPTPIGTLFELGMQVNFTEIKTPAGIDIANVGGLAACEEKALYVVIQDAASAFSLYFSSDSGLSFRKVVGTRADGSTFTVAAKSGEIACDDGELFTMDFTKQIYRAPRIANGDLQIATAASDPWVRSAAAPLVNHIGGGDGTIYGLVTSTHTLYKSTTHTGNPADISWTQVATIGSNRVTGGGSSNVTDTLAWPRRAFTTEPDGTVFLNDTILAGQNSWTFLSTGSERFNLLSAGTTNFLYGIDTTNGSRLVTVSLTESNCTDGLDNDANGKKDSEDPACIESAAIAFCARGTTMNGTYCVDRYEPGTFLGQTNQNAGVVTCSNHLVVPPVQNGPKVPKVGVCVRVGTSSDRLKTQAELAGSDPTGTGRWCNMIWPSTQKWDFAFGGTDPCATLRGRNPTGGVVVRAGLYSTGENSVLANCNNGAVIARGTGGTPLQNAFDSVGHTANACIFTASPSKLPLWSQPYPITLQPASTHHNHTFSIVALAQFGHGQAGTSIDIDRLGFTGDPHDIREHAYDIFLPEGAPLYAVADGTVVTNGSRDRDVTRFACPTSYQGELMIKYVTGSNATYQETVVAVYAHIRRRLVVDGQTVKAGQIIGYVGRTGCAGSPHVHFGVIRLSNSNAHTTANPALGYHFGLVVDDRDAVTNASFGLNIDPMGWTNSSALDPSGYQDRNTDTGLGWLGFAGWSIDLFKDSDRPNL